MVNDSQVEMFFFYADFKNNDLAFRSGTLNKCLMTRVPELFKFDLVNYSNLWDYLFFFENNQKWRFEWPFKNSLFKRFYSSLHYEGPTNQQGIFPDLNEYKPLLPISNSE